MIYSGLIIEGLGVGFVTTLFGILITYLITLFSNLFLKKNVNLSLYSSILVISLSYFLTGFVIHILFEYIGLNKQFCCKQDRFVCK